MSSPVSPPAPAASQQAVVEAALVLLERMGLSPADLVAAPASQPVVPTFAEYVPVVSAAVSAGTRRAYGSYWNRIVEQWGARRHRAGPFTSCTRSPATTPPRSPRASGNTRSLMMTLAESPQSCSAEFPALLGHQTT